MAARLASLFRKGPTTPPTPERLAADRGGELPLHSPARQPRTPSSAARTATQLLQPCPAIVVPSSEAVNENALSMRTDAARPSMSSIMMSVTPTADPRPSISSALGDSYSSPRQQQQQQHEALDGSQSNRNNAAHPADVVTEEEENIAAGQHPQAARAPPLPAPRAQLNHANLDAYGMPELQPIDQSALAARRRTRGSRNPSISSPVLPRSNTAGDKEAPPTCFPRALSDPRAQAAVPGPPLVLAPVRTLVQPTAESSAWVLEL